MRRSNKVAEHPQICSQCEIVVLCVALNKKVRTKTDMGGCLQMGNRLTVVAIVMEMVVVEDPPPLTHCPPLPLTER